MPHITVYLYSDAYSLCITTYILDLPFSVKISPLYKGDVMI